MKYKYDHRGAWQFEGGHTFDACLAAGIAKVFYETGVHSVMDIGCGDGSYTQYLHGYGFECIGYDGNPYTEKIIGGLCYVTDFSDPQSLGRRDAVLSLEVGEHIPEEYEDIFIANLDKHADKLIILSWALPEQGGHGHVNERPNDYIIKKLAALGWAIDQTKTNYLRNKAEVFWFKDTVMVFTDGN